MNYIIPFFAVTLAVIPFALGKSQIYDYFIASDDGEVETRAREFACVNTQCYYYERSVPVVKGDYVEIMRYMRPGRGVIQTYWFILFICFSVLWYYSFRETRENLDKEALERTAGDRDELSSSFCELE